MTLGEKIKQARMYRDITQAELAKKLNVSNSRIGNWEQDTNKPNIDMIKEMCDIFNINPNYFFDEQTTTLDEYTNGSDNDFDIHNSENFLKKLDKLMEQNGLNKNTLSKESGIPYTTIDGWYKKGYEGVKLTTLKKLAKFFNVSLDFWASDDVTERFSTTPNQRTSYEEPTSTQEDTTDDPYADMDPKVAAELRKLNRLEYKPSKDRKIYAFGGYDIENSPPEVKAEVEKIKRSQLIKAKNYIFEWIGDNNKKAAVIGYDSGEKTEIFLDEQETRIVLNVIKGLREK